MVSKLKKIFKSNKGLSCIETAICTLILLTCIVAFFDVTIIGNKFSAMSTNMTYATRTLSNQGGVRMYPNSDWPVGKDYINSSYLYSNIKKGFNNAGIKDTEWNVKINGVTLSPTTMLSVDRNGEIEVEMTIKYKWDTLASISPINPTFEKTIKRYTISTYKIRNGGLTTDF